MDAIRLPVIEAPRSWFMRLLYWGSRRTFGHVIFAISVLYVRMPRLIWPQLLMMRLGATRLHLPPALVHHLQIEVSRVNGCGFCVDLHQAVAMRDGLAARSADPACEVAFRYAHEVNARSVSDATFRELRACFDERQVVEITWLVAFTAYLNTMARALALPAQGLCTLPPP